MKYLKVVIEAIVIIIFTYAALAFCEWEMNPKEWHFISRFIIGVGLVAVCMAAVKSLE